MGRVTYLRLPHLKDDLLCFVAGLLDGGGPLATLLTRLQDLLTQILGALGGLRA